MPTGNPSDYRQPAVTFADTFPVWVSGVGAPLHTRIRTTGEMIDVGPCQLAMLDGVMQAVLPARNTETVSSPPTALWSWVTLLPGRPGHFVRWIGQGMRMVERSAGRGQKLQSLLPASNDLIAWRIEGPSGIQQIAPEDEIARQYPAGFAAVQEYLRRPRTTPVWRDGKLYDARGVPCLERDGDRWCPLMVRLTGSGPLALGPRGGQYGFRDPEWTWYDPDAAGVRSMSGADVVQVYYGLLDYQYEGLCPVYRPNRELTPSPCFDADPFAFVREYRLRQLIWSTRTDLREIRLADGKVIPGLIPPDQIPAMNGMPCKQSWGEQVGGIAVAAVMSFIPGIGVAYTVAMYGKQIADMMKSARTARESAALVEQIQQGAAAAAQMPALPPPPPPPPSELEERASGQPATGESPPAAGGSILPAVITIILLML